MLVIGAFVTAKDLVLPPLARVAVEDDQVARLSRTPVHVFGGLQQPFAYCALQAPVQHLALDHEPTRGVRCRATGSRPDDQQIGAPPPQAVLALDAPAAVHDSLQERLQQELRTRLGVVEARRPMLGVLAEEPLEVGQQLVQVKTTVGVYVPRRIVQQLLLDGEVSSRGTTSA